MKSYPLACQAAVGGFCTGDTDVQEMTRQNYQEDGACLWAKPRVIAAAIVYISDTGRVSRAYIPEQLGSIPRMYNWCP